MSINRESQDSMDELSSRISSLSPAKRALLELKLKKGAGSTQTIPHRVTGEAAPLSFSQQRLWFINQLDPESAVYNIVRAIRLNGTLDVTALRQSLDAIVDRHEVLRTNIVTVDGEPAQIVRESRPVRFSTSDLRTLPTADREQAVPRICTTEARQPFNLLSDLMLRGTLIQLAEDEHVLVLTTHHIASDGWSSGVLLQDLAAFYRAFSNGEPYSPLPELPIQYADFAVWQRKSLQGEVLDDHLSYWRKQLNGAPSILELPTDRPRPTIQSFRGARRSFRVSRDLTEALKKLSQREGVTLFMTLVAAFKTLMFRYARQTDVVIGVPIANRTRPETEKLIGFFVNNLVLRTDLSGNPSFRELLRRLREVAFGAYSHQDLPFEKLVEELHPERNLSHSPLFQVMFGLQNVPRQKFDLPGLTVTLVELNTETAKFDLFLSMLEDDGSLRGMMEYNTDLFEQGTIARMLRHYERLLEGIVANPDERIGELGLLPENEKRQLLREWNETQADYRTEQCIHELFEVQAERYPDSIAVLFEEEKLTYEELNQAANRLAHYLRRRGVGPEVLVGVCMERSVRMLIAVLGVLKAGGAYVPLDPSYPQERLVYMVEDAQVPIMLTESGLTEILAGQGLEIICLDRIQELLYRESAGNPSMTAGAQNLAYVIYTSGSTGKPKGVPVQHLGVVNFLSCMGRAPGLSRQDTLLSVTTLSFDIAGLELFLPLALGARVALVSREVAADGAALLERLNRYGATVMQSTPATWRLLLDAGWKGKKDLKILCGGEMLSSALASELLERGSSVWNLYGPTETTIWSASEQVLAGAEPVTVGRPIDNTEIYVFDEHFEPAPIGVPGELFIGGVGLARGYLNRPELSAERFVPNPFSDDPGARLYRTGDLARFGADGKIVVLGRLDHQVKIRGFRIELGEIESVLAKHPQIQHAAVTVHEDRKGDRRLVAYTVPRPESVLSPNDIRTFAKKQLPDYMVPSFWITVDSLPLTPNGKVNRHGLLAPQLESTRSTEQAVRPRDPIELELFKIWENVLDRNSIGVTDNFFDLGGHSLIAVRLFSQIEKKLGKKLPLALLFQAPTIGELASYLRREEWTPSWSSLVAIQPTGSNPPFFCVHAHGGNVLNFKDLARHLGKSQPLYGLQAVGLDGTQRRHDRIEDMAAHYLQEVKTVQPSGPYLLGGYCFGGKVAFEMAHQLRAAGESVALLALIDAYAPGYRTSLPWFQRRVAQFKFHWRNFRKLEAKKKLDYIGKKGAIAGAKAARGIKRIAAKACLSLGLALPPTLQGALKTRGHAVQPYRPKVYPGKIDVFAPSDTHSAYFRFEPHLGWDGLALKGLEIHKIPGTVAAIVEEPYVQELARQLCACIDKATVVKDQEQSAI